MEDLKEKIYNQMGGNIHDITTDEAEMYKFLEIDRENKKNMEKGFHMIPIILS